MGERQTRRQTRETATRSSSNPRVWWRELIESGATVMGRGWPRGEGMAQITERAAEMTGMTSPARWGKLRKARPDRR